MFDPDKIDPAKNEALSMMTSENHSRYTFIKISERDPRQIMCFDNILNKNVWGTHKSVEGLHGQRVFVPNI